MADRLSIRPAVSTDHAALDAIYRNASLANEGDRAALLANPDVLKFASGRIEIGGVLVAERGNTIAGFASISLVGEGTAELDDLFVEQAHWNNGIGRALVEALLEYGRARGVERLTVVGNPHAVGFYLACGFEAIGPTETQFGPGLRLIHRL
jgi:GNAT superfamily N-acetyltransferase